MRAGEQIRFLSWREILFDEIKMQRLPKCQIYAPTEDKHHTQDGLIQIYTQSLTLIHIILY